MRKLIYIFTTLIVFAACESKISVTQAQSNIIKEQADFTLEKIIALQNPPKKIPKWTAPIYNGLQLGKAVQRDVSKMFGKPLKEFQPFSEDESINNEWTFYYENINNFNGQVSFIFDRRSKILKEVWLRPNDESLLPIEKAIEIYGNDYFVRGTDQCSAKQLTQLKYPFTIVYPHKGIYLWVREAATVTEISYTAKCP